MPTKKLIILLSTPRAGSTPVAQILAHYYFQTAGYHNLSEFFNVQSVGVKEKKGIISTFDIPTRLSIDRKKLDRERKRRWLLLAKSKEKYFLKAFPEMLEEKSTNWLKKNTQIIYLQRKNIFEHLLSSLASAATGKYYSRNGLKFKQGSINARSDHFFDFIVTQKHFHRILSREKNPKIVYYEDFVRLTPKNFLKTIGLKKKVNWSDFKTVEKQNQKNKLALFSNQEAILQWYQESKLQKIFKI